MTSEESSESGSNQLKLNIFEYELENCPKPTNNSMIFPWNIDICDFQLEENFSGKTAQGRITIEEISNILQRMRNKVNNYQISRGTGSCWIWACIGFFLGLVILGILILTKNKEFGVGTFLIILILFSCFGCLFEASSWEKLVKRRGIEISDFIDIVNSEYEARAVKWSSGKLGSYLQVSILSLRRMSLIKKGSMGTIVIPIQGQLSKVQTQAIESQSIVPIMIVPEPEVEMKRGLSQQSEAEVMDNKIEMAINDENNNQIVVEVKIQEENDRISEARSL